MTRFKHLFLALALVASVSSAWADDSGTCGDNLNWSYDGAGTLTITGTDDMWNFTYMANEPWYSFQADITSVSLPNGITRIGEHAFYNCSNLATINLPSGLLTIGNGAFDHTALTAVVLPEGVTTLGMNAFNYCQSLVSVTIPTSVTNLSRQAFWNCILLADVTVHWTTNDALPTLGTDVFSNIKANAKLHVPYGTTSLYSAAAQWSSFNIVEMNPQGKCGDNLYWEYDINGTHALTITGSGEMYDYSSSADVPWYSYRNNITSISLPTGLTSIGNSAFLGCTGLTSIDIPASVTYIGMNTFYGCSSLASIVIPSGVTEIGLGAFKNCSSLTSITIPSGVTVINESTFEGCSNLASATLPNNITEINQKAFYGCSSLTSIVLPSALTKIWSYAFQNCTGLMSISIPANVTIIYQEAFRGCSSLSSVIIPDGVTHIASSAFRDCSNLTSIDIPGSIIGLTNYVFKGCSSLADVTVHWTDLSGLTIKDNMFDGLTLSGINLHVPCETKSIYEAAEPWSGFVPNIVEYGCPVASVTTSGSVTTNYTTFAAALAAWEANSTLTLLDNVEISDRIEVTEAKTLDLNGYGIKNGGGLHEVIYIHGSGAHLTLEDSNPTAPHKYDYNSSNLLATLNEASGANIVLGGYITGGNGNTTETNIYAGNNMANGGGIFVYDGATFTMNGGNIIGNRTHAISGREARHGGGVFVAKNSHFILNGGRITHNYAQYGGGVAVYGSTSDVPEQGPSDMVMTGGEISYNFATTNCGGISTNGRNAHITLTITGGIITENRLKPTATQRAGGIGFDTNMTFNLSGNPTIDNNYNASGAEENIYVGTGRVLTINGPLTNTEPIGITMGTEGVFTSGLSGNGTVANFAMENSGTYLVTNSNGEAAILAPMAVTANADPKKPTDYYSTFYDGTIKYAVPAGVEVYTAEISGTDMLLHLIASAGDVLPWDKAVILKTTGAALELIPTDDAPTAASAANVLQGTDVAMSAPANCYVLSGHSSDNSINEVGFYTFSGTLGAHKAYVVIPGASPAPQHLRFVFGTTTDIEEVESGETRVESQKILRDGQLIILRNGVEYNANGQMLK